MNKSPHFNNYNTGQQQRRIEVRTYDGLVNAISALMSNYSNLTSLVPYIGYEIIICDSIVVPQTIVLPVQVSGIRITSAGKVPIIPKEQIDSLFDIQSALMVTIDSLNVVSNSHYFDKFVKVTSYSPTSLDLDGPVICNNNLKVQTVYTEALGNVDRAMIHHNNQSLPTTGANAIETSSDFVLIESNSLGGNGIVVTGARHRIIGNHLNAGNITTNGGGGNGYVVANTQIGVGTYAGTDVVL